MLSKKEISDILDELDITQKELSVLLLVNERTVRRWVSNPIDMPYSAEQALRSWIHLKRYNLPWRPNCFHLLEDDKRLAYQICLLRNKYIGMESIFERGRENGRPKLPWIVDLKKGIAKLETIKIRFINYNTSDFCPLSYEKKGVVMDKNEFEKHKEIFEDGICAIYRAQAINTINSKK